MNYGGEILDVTDNTDKDVIMICDDFGEVFKTMELPEWTIQENTFMADNKEYKYYQIDNKGYAQTLFEFLATHTGVEWHFAKLKEKQSKAHVNFITTSNSHNRESVMGKLLHGKINGLYVSDMYNLYELIHNHPGGSTYPSIIVDNQGNLVGDIPFAKRVLKRYGGEIDFKIFTKPNTYTSYQPD